MVTYYQHIPVMLHECMDALITDADGIYIDATLGGGGHTKRILELVSENAQVYGIDQDDEAHTAAAAYIGNDDRFHPVKGNFGFLGTILPQNIKGNISGILLDLGVSTHQIKEGERGFSFQEDGPLDMRMGNMTGITAYQIVNEYPYEALRDIIFHYGEEKNSRKIAQAIIDSRPINTTGQLAEIVKKQTNTRFEIKTLARVFQAIRIEVNNELQVLKQVLEQLPALLKPGGRMVVMSYHSLEDRIVKRFFKTGNVDGKIEKDFYGNVLSPIKMVNKQVITPSEEEIKKNPAARSAKLRIAEKLMEGEIDF